MNTSLAQSGASRREEVWARLATVSDPELDRSVAEMGFVESVELGAGGVVGIGFRLPTFWCAPNFAFLMARDMRHAVESLDWVSRAEISLRDHCHGEEINRGVGAGMSFAETFPGQATAELDELRATFRRKAFQGRQEMLLRRLLAQGFKAAQLCAMRIGELTALELAASELANSEFAPLRQRYLEIRGEFGGEFGGSAAGEDFAFTTPEGEALDGENFSEYLRDLRRVRMNAAFNANMCQSLLQTRYADDKAGE
jgi:metal-sulfur cluster biosynthetic enzyme